MTTTFEVPQSVLDNKRRRALTNQPQPCGEGTGQGLTCRAFPTRLHPAGWRCQVHRPQPVNPVPDPTRTAAALRARAGEPVTAVTPVTPVTTLTPPTPSLTDQFTEFNARNPHVMQRLEELIAEHVTAGASRLGMGALFEQLRGQVETNGRRWQLDNTLRADYARALVTAHPERAHLFEVRQRRSA